ncbi:hypothetical protein [Enterocloster clostridioformis]|nr:hypothetical protein [Enterocloster clostridioformis]
MDLQYGTIHIYQSKGHKDRLIYVATDLTEPMSFS